MLRVKPCRHKNSQGPTGHSQSKGYSQEVCKWGMVEPRLEGEGQFMQDLEYLNTELKSYRLWPLPNSPTLSVTYPAPATPNCSLFPGPTAPSSPRLFAGTLPGPLTLPSSSCPHVSISELADYSSQANSSLRPQLKCKPALPDMHLSGSFLPSLVPHRHWPFSQLTLTAHHCDFLFIWHSPPGASKHEVGSVSVLFISTSQHLEGQ